MSEFAAIQEVGEVIDAPVSNANIAELEARRVLFFAGDTIRDIDKRELPFTSFGGIFMPHVKGLGNKGMLYRCQLTRLPKYKMVGDWRNMLGERAAATHEDSFVQTVMVNGEPVQRVVKGFLESDPTADKETGEFKQKRSNHIVYRKRYSAQDAALAQRRTMGNSVRGVVEVTALKNATDAELKEAQLFFFPEWAEIKTGSKALPEKMVDLQDHLKSRIEAVRKMDWSEEKKNKFFAIGNDMVRSCTEFIRHTGETIRSDEIIVKDAAAKGAAGTIQHSDISEKYLALTGTRRKDDLITGEASAVSELTREMREERKAKAENEARLLLLEERKQYVAELNAGLRERDLDEEVRLGMRKQPLTDADGDGTPDYRQTDAPAVAEDEVTVAPPSVVVEEDVRVCGKPTAFGAPCERKLKDDEEACFQHAK